MSYTFDAKKFAKYLKTEFDPREIERELEQEGVTFRNIANLRQSSDTFRSNSGETSWTYTLVTNEPAPKPIEEEDVEEVKFE